jgi:hypothetical protein
MAYTVGMTIAAGAMLLGVIILVFFETALLHFFNKRLKIAHTTYLHCLVIAASTMGLGAVFQICEFAFPNAALFIWGTSIVATTVLAYYLYQFYFRCHTLRFLTAWIGSIITFVGVSILIIGLCKLYVIEPVVILDDKMLPTYHTGDYVFIEKYSRTAGIGDVVLVGGISTTLNGLSSLELLRVRKLSGSIVEGRIVPPGSYYATNDFTPQTSGAVISPAQIVGKPLFDLGTI